MTETAWIFLFDHISEYISGLTALIMAVVAYRGLEKRAEQKVVSLEQKAATLEVSQKVAQVIETTDKIKVATDGGLTDVKAELKAVTEQSKTLVNQNLAFQETIKVLSEAMATRTTTAKRETGELLAAEEKNGNSVTHMMEELAKLNKQMAEFAEKGIPVIAPAGEPLPVMPVKAGEGKK